MNAVSFSGLGKDYGGVGILSEINLAIPADASTALIGRSGSGKSTLLKTINGLVVPDRGSVSVFGEPVRYDNLVALRRGIGYAVQGSGLFPHLTVSANICLLARLENWDVARVERRLLEVADIVQLEAALLQRFPFELSGGQQQRASLARAMMLNPPLLLLDEPFGALDPLTRVEVHKQFLRAQSLEPRSLLLVTHDMREALKLADHIVVLESGRVVLQGGADELRERHPDLEAEALLLALLGESA